MHQLSHRHPARLRALSLCLSDAVYAILSVGNVMVYQNALISHDADMGV